MGALAIKAKKRVKIYFLFAKMVVVLPLAMAASAKGPFQAACDVFFCMRVLLVGRKGITWWATTDAVMAIPKYQSLSAIFLV